MRYHPASLPTCLPAMVLLLGLGPACYPDSDKIRNPTTQQADASPDGTLDLAPVADTWPGPPEGTDGLLADAPAERAAPDLAPEAPKPDGLADSGAGVETRCQAYAQSVCKTYQACAQGQFARDYETQELCRSRLQQGCALRAGLPGATWPTVQCATASGTQGCKDFLDGVDPVECFAPGLGPQGSDCSSEIQCQGRRCVFYTGLACGVCNDRSPAGGKCTGDSSCQRGLRCGDGVCRVPGSVGSTCDDAHPCAVSLHCSTAAGKCIERLPEGATCDTTSLYDECDWRSTAVRCSPGSQKCIKSSPSTLSCTWDKAADTIKFCSGGRSCSAGMCLPVPGIGESCDDEKGPDCMYPDYCDANTSTCQPSTYDWSCGPV